MNRATRKVLLAGVAGGSALAIMAAPALGNEGNADATCVPNSDQIAQPGGMVNANAGIALMPLNTTATVTWRVVADGKDGFRLDDRQYTPGEEVLPPQTVTLQPGAYATWSTGYLHQAVGRVSVEIISAKVTFNSTGKVEWVQNKGPIAFRASLGCISTFTTTPGQIIQVPGPTVTVTVPGPERIVYKTRIIRRVVVRFHWRNRIIRRVVVVRAPVVIPYTP